ncbi:metal ABC transporter permease [Inmirania thermothiophila]|uniref:High-affinity zinc uptake system membrane protein ZnuB n=1 Tax=Inmirania thermothiophila TaxID=1750597 RepID=A0A3N1XZF2_9GAMM|nr:metal ABC transporter permease [Inmirania thermothiophila]ROR31984.1 zinc transport system permease protein [Inmirania thermothiophila]
MDELLARALAAGAGVVLATAPLGCFVVWRRMAYFGDALAHTALPGVAAGIALGIAPQAGAAAVLVAAALLLGTLRRRGRLADDTLLGILAHTALAAGIVLIGALEGLRLDLLGYLFGDLLAVDDAGLAWIGATALAVNGALVLLWRPLVAATVSEELARAEGMRVGAAQTAYAVLVALAVAVGMQAVGVLLVTAMLVMPAAAAALHARTPEQMALLAAGAGLAAVAAGLAAAFRWDLPAGPAVVLAAAALLALAALAALAARR